MGPGGPWSVRAEQNVQDLVAAIDKGARPTYYFFWGHRDPRLWRGLNLLGFALMQVRERLRKRA